MESTSKVNYWPWIWFGAKVAEASDRLEESGHRLRVFIGQPREDKSWIGFCIGYALATKRRIPQLTEQELGELNLRAKIGGRSVQIMEIGWKEFTRGKTELAVGYSDVRNRRLTCCMRAENFIREMVRGKRVSINDAAASEAESKFQLIKHGLFAAAENHKRNHLIKKICGSVPFDQRFIPVDCVGGKNKIQQAFNNSFEDECIRNILAAPLTEIWPDKGLNNQLRDLLRNRIGNRMLFQSSRAWLAWSRALVTKNEVKKSSWVTFAFRGEPAYAVALGAAMAEWGRRDKSHDADLNEQIIKPIQGIFQTKQISEMEVVTWIV